MQYRDKKEKITLPEIPCHYQDKLDALLHEIKSKNERAVLKLKKIYSYMDEFHEFVSTFTVCGKCCSHCCKIDVHITKLEAKFIESESGQPARQDLVKRSSGNMSDCPFLNIDGSCSIYAIRPFNCRTFYTLDNPKYCETGEPHKVYGSSNGVYYVTIFDELNDILLKLNKHANTFDIRDYFP